MCRASGAVDFMQAESSATTGADHRDAVDAKGGRCTASSLLCAKAGVSRAGHGPGSHEKGAEDLNG